MMAALRTIVLVMALTATAPVHSSRSASSRLELVKTFETFKLVGIAVSRSGRIFASAPAAQDGDKVIEIDTASGKSVSFPANGTSTAFEGDPVWFAPQALWVDENDYLWVLDSGRPTLPTPAPTGSPKLVQFDLARNAIVRTYTFDGVVAPEDSLNDVRVDVRRGYAYLANIGRHGSLVVLDLTTGKARQVLVGDRSTRAAAGEFIRVGGQEGLVGDRKSLSVHADGIALSPDGRWLYYRTLTDHNYWRIRTAVLANETLSETQVAQAVEFMGRGPITGGLIMDHTGTLYGGDLEHGTVVAITPGRTGSPLRSKVFAEAGSRLAWADGFAISKGYLYIADARLSETAFKNHLPKRGNPAIYRVRLPR